MSRIIQTEHYSQRLRLRVVKPLERRILASRLEGSPQVKDLTIAPNCGGIGRIRHFRRHGGNAQWPPNPLPIDPATRALGLSNNARLEAQVFQIAACNWRCWYCFVPFSMLEANPLTSIWVTAKELVDLYLAEPVASQPKVIDLTGGQPDLAPEWILWMMEELECRGLEGRVFLWSDDNLSTDFFWRFLSDDERAYMVRFKNYARVCCFKGFSPGSFAFNTLAAPELFEMQFDLFRRLLRAGLDLYAYATFTSPDVRNVDDEMRGFVDRLQAIHPNLPLRTVPLRIEPYGVVSERIAARRTANAISTNVWEAQERAVEAWSRELDARFNAEARRANVADVVLR